MSGLHSIVGWLLLNAFSVLVFDLFSVKPITFFAGFKSITFRLWDEQRHTLVSFRALRAMRRPAKATTN